MTLTLNSWSANKALNNLISICLFFFIILSLLIFFRSETVFFSILVTSLLIVAILNKIRDKSQSLIIMAALLFSHTAFFVFFNTDLDIYLTAALLAIIITGIIHNTIPEVTNLSTFIVIIFTTICSFLIADILPASILILSLLSSLPLMVLLPILLEDNNGLPKQLMHATVTGIMGAGVITATAILFI